MRNSPGQPRTPEVGRRKTTCLSPGTPEALRHCRSSQDHTPYASPRASASPSFSFDFSSRQESSSLARECLSESSSSSQCDSVSRMRGPPSGQRRGFMSTETFLPALSRRPRLLELHTRHLGLVGKSAAELAAGTDDPLSLEGALRTLDVFRACGPLHERGGATPALRLASESPQDAGETEAPSSEAGGAELELSAHEAKLERTMAALQRGDPNTRTKRAACARAYANLRYAQCSRAS
ncbi:hypothetical protein AB1Y20_000111 [Prymnesium parvum]|uniref:Uncharacterized protein n=1 Tax=Prymnesium parvum TaxID=97485 RepID=A0AB34K771_PRYPA